MNFDCLVAGRLVRRSVEHTINPATGKAFASFAAADAMMVDEAVSAAQAAFPAWRDTPLADRRAALRRLASRITDHSDELARLLTLEQGKPLAEAKEEVALSAWLLGAYADMRSDFGDTMYRDETAAHIQTFDPLGVVAGIIPWNMPLLIAAMKIAPALLLGNVIILKPAPTTPITTLRFTGLAAADVPPGVLQALGDDGTVGPMLSTHDAVAKLSFTGSTATGRSVMAASAPTLKRLTLELGGNDPAIVLDDADPVLVADKVFQGAFRNCGQVCGAVKRLYLQSGIYDEVSGLLAARVAAMVVGDGLDPATTIGPVQNAAQHRQATRLLDAGLADGRLVAQATAPGGDGYFIAPSIIGDLPADHPLVMEEQFAPILPIIRFDEDAEAVAHANNVPYGLTASVWSGDQARAEALAGQIDASLVCINRHNENPEGLGLSMAKQSGIGWLMGDEGAKEYAQARLVVR